MWYSFIIIFLATFFTVFNVFLTIRIERSHKRTQEALKQTQKMLLNSMYGKYSNDQSKTQ